MGLGELHVAKKHRTLETGQMKEMIKEGRTGMSLIRPDPVRGLQGDFICL